MGLLSRRRFITNTAGVLAFTFADLQAFASRNNLKLSFSTLGCPDWTLDQVLAFAVKHNYSGIEIRGIQRQLDLSKSPHFANPSAIAQTKQAFKRHKLEIIGLGSSAAMHHPDDSSERSKAMDEAKQFIDLARQLKCPYVRVFPDKIAEEGRKEEVLALIVSGVNELGAYAQGTGVKVLMETHGDLVKTDDIVAVMKQVNSRNVGLVWDIANMWMVTGEEPQAVYPRLKSWIRHTHLKDLKIVGGKVQYTLMGEGDAPVLEAVKILVNNNYRGYLSFEWEKMWHPEIAEPEVAFEQFSRRMQAEFPVK